MEPARLLNGKGANNVSAPFDRLGDVLILMDGTGGMVEFDQDFETSARQTEVALEPSLRRRVISPQPALARF